MMSDDDVVNGKCVEIVTINYTVRVVSNSPHDPIKKLSDLALSLLKDIKVIEGGSNGSD